jgi:Asp-tRNA(Asn)/Glu-tRNA(Gln) amidotransferase A subunit family amidase
MRTVDTGISRRRFFSSFATLGIASTMLPGKIWAGAQDNEGVITSKIIAEAEKTVGLQFTEAEREMMLSGLDSALEEFDAIRKLEISNDVPPALSFNPIPVNEVPARCYGGQSDKPDRGVSRPTTENELAFMTLAQQAELIRTREISSEELTKIYLKRLHKENELLECVITFTEERAIRMARKADKEIASGNYRGPLHGIPWGAKDLLAVQGYPTTWGATPYKEQRIDEDAAVVKRLDAAGAVLIAKTTLGALAMGDYWFDGKTRNPWDPSQGSSGSSAGSASATAAGLMSFAIGSETLGSIVSPATRCGVTGLRPTFGRVSKAGAMALSWSMDKLGPLARSVEDCAYIFAAINGADGVDLTAVDRPFTWKQSLTPRKIKIGYVRDHFERELSDKQKEGNQFDKATLKILKALGFQMVPITLPDMPAGAISTVLTVEAAAAFDELTRSGQDDLLVRQTKGSWPNIFRTARMIPAVEYVQANRARTILMQQMAETLKDVDLYVTPSFAGSNLTITNLTGHPAVVLPNGFRKENGTPTSITFNGKLFGEDLLLTVSHMYQKATEFHLKHPDLELTRKMKNKKDKES